MKKIDGRTLYERVHSDVLYQHNRERATPAAWPFLAWVDRLYWDRMADRLNAHFAPPKPRRKR